MIFSTFLLMDCSMPTAAISSMCKNYAMMRIIIIINRLSYSSNSRLTKCVKNAIQNAGFKPRYGVDFFTVAERLLRVEDRISGCANIRAH
jgi:hypothetical protein